MVQPEYNISTEKAFDLLKAGKPVAKSYVGGELKIETNEHWHKEVIFENCIIEDFSGSVTQFEKSVRLANCHFKNCQFVFTYFLGGLTIDNCIFDNYLDFQAGGHNVGGEAVALANNDFKGFVNFFDCWYEGEVSICNNRFEKGTNLLGKPHSISVTFDTIPLIKENVGQLNLNNEGG